MTTREVPKVRLVKCPKCRRLLAESPDLPVYECGGCGIVLEAKIRKNEAIGTKICQNEANSTKMDLPETNIIPSKELKNPVEEIGSSSSSQNGSPKDQLEVLKLPREVSSSAEVTDREIVVSSNIQVPTADDDEQMDHSQEITVPGFDSVISTVTSETTEQMNPDSDLSGAIDDTPAPTTRSVSSSDESETINQVLYPSVEAHRMFKDAEFAGVQERLMRERGKFPVNAEVQDQARNSFSSDISDSIMKYSEWSGDQPPKHPRNSHQMRLEDNESLTEPFYLKNGSPSSHWHDEFQGTSSLCSPENPSNYSQEKIRLLRMVYKLQDQLDKTYVSGEQNVPTRGAYHNHEVFQEEWYNGSGPFGHSRYPRRYREGEECSQHSRSSQLPFSGEAFNRDRFQADHQYPHCHCYIEPGRINLAHNCYSGVQSSRPPVHQPWMDSIIPSQDPYSESDELGYRADERRKFHSREKIHAAKKHYRPIASGPPSISPSRDSYSKSDELGYRADERRKFHSREKTHAAKKHYRPIASGAPFISCYHCLEPLQLPADFLLFKRRCHKLRCGACTTVLNFSLENNNHILPFVPGKIDNHRKMPYGNSFAPGEERVKPSFFKQSPININKNPVNSDVEAESSSSKSLGMKKQAHGNAETARKTKPGSPLHRLMGYTSASELLRSESSQY